MIPKITKNKEFTFSPCDMSSIIKQIKNRSFKTFLRCKTNLFSITLYLVKVSY